MNNCAQPDSRKSGFSLIEIMAAMIILLLLMVMISTIFVSSNQAWDLATSQAENNTDGRAAIDLMADDLQYAVADPTLSFMMRRDRNVTVSYDFTNDEICFVSLQNDSDDGNRTAREIHYYVREDPASPGRYQLVRGYWSGAIVSDYANHCYYNTDWFETGGSNPGRPTANAVIADNIVGLAFFTDTGASYYDSRANSDRLPEYVDIYLEILSDNDAQEVENREAASYDARDFLDRRLRKYTTRVHFFNRHGYQTR